jgi:hypothetical protein
MRAVVPKYIAEVDVEKRMPEKCARLSVDL